MVVLIPLPSTHPVVPLVACPHPVAEAVLVDALVVASMVVDSTDVSVVIRSPLRWSPWW